jgi:DNA polymerase/3'-5' exonuclease PolX
MGEAMIETPEEEDLFKLFGLDFIPPERRNEA